MPRALRVALGGWVYHLSAFMRWLTMTHTQRWHAAAGTAGAGHVYQGRFKSFPIQRDEHLLTVKRSAARLGLRCTLRPPEGTPAAPRPPQKDATSRTGQPWN